MTGGRIVVGVDGSDGARRALRWAVEEARRRGAVVEAVFAYTLPATGGGIGMGPVPTPVRPEQVEAETTSELRTQIDAVVPRAERDIEVIPRVVRGRPAQSLLEAAAKADLLVVGARGLGGFRGLLLGSVSQQCVAHAPCPVVVVPGS